MRCGSVRSEELLCAECAGVPKLAAHKYSDFSKEITNILDKKSKQNIPIVEIW